MKKGKKVYGTKKIASSNKDAIRQVKISIKSSSIAFSEFRKSLQDTLTRSL